MAEAKETPQTTDKKECIFCDIASGKTDGEILYSDDEYVCVVDIKPHASHHYLVVPKVHHQNVKYLNSDHCKIVERLGAIGRQVLSDKNCTLSDSRLGFHWPPFQSIEHLHMHVLSPVSSMNFVSRRMIFRHNYPLITLEWALEYLQKNKINNRDDN